MAWEFPIQRIDPSHSTFMSISKKKEIKKAVQEKEFPKEEAFTFSEETILSLNELGSVLGKIHKRLIKEGYIIKGNKILKANGNN